jgi:hypothetical protein
MGAGFRPLNFNWKILREYKAGKAFPQNFLEYVFEIAVHAADFERVRPALWLPLPTTALQGAWYTGGFCASIR